MTKTYDVAIIGAGPAGSSAAITLARAGRTVALIDKATFPRDKICGDGLTTSALRELSRLGVDPTGLGSWTQCSSVTVRAGNGYAVEFPITSDGVRVGVVQRRELDALLVDTVRHESVDLYLGEGLDEITQHTSEVAITTTKGTAFSASYVIAADGMWSPTRKLIAPHDTAYLGEFHAFRQYFDNVHGPAATEMFVYFDDDLLPGYFWTFPLSNHRANVGFGILRGSKLTTHDMKRVWPDLLARPHVAALLGDQATPAEPHRAWPIPCRVTDVVTHHDRVLFVGDAVAACDVLTGEGIGQALKTGSLAARTIHQRFDDPNEVGSSYQHELLAEFAPDHRMASWLSRCLSHRKGVRYSLRLANATGWTRRHFSRWLFEDLARGYAIHPSIWGASTWHAAPPQFGSRR